ncbi:11311_t:CDS:2, partial [Ambispora gerdemannii]
SEDIHLKSFLNLLEKLINPNDRDLVDHTISQRQKGLSFLCHFLVEIGNKHISALKKDIAMFLDHSGTSDQAIDTLSNMQLSSISRENRHGKNIISSIHRDNVARELVKYQVNVLIANIDDYHNIHGLHIPTTMSTNTVAHMTTVLAILISTASAIPKSVGNANIHNLRLVDSNILITQIENQFMALLSQSFNNQFARKSAYAENDLLDNLTLNLHSTETYIKAMETFASFPEFHEYLQHNVIPLVADWPGQILPRKVITMQQQQARKNIQTEKHLVAFSDYPVENYYSLIRQQTRETDTSEQLSRMTCVINCLRYDNVFQSTFVLTTKYPYCKEDLI